MPGLNSVNPLLAKLLLVVLLTLMILLPLSRVEGLIAERATLRDSAVARVASGVGRAQPAVVGGRNRERSRPG